MFEFTLADDFMRMMPIDELRFENLFGDWLPGELEEELTPEEEMRFNSLFGEASPNEPADNLTPEEELRFYNLFGAIFEEKPIFGWPVSRASLLSDELRAQLLEIVKELLAAVETAKSQDPSDASLWKIERNGERLAKVTALEHGAGMKGLASCAGLDEGEILKWLRDGNGDQLEKTPALVLKGNSFMIPNVWIAADLMRGGDLIDRGFLNLGGTLGTFVGTDIFTSGFKVEKPTSFNGLISSIKENAGCIWGLALFAHGTPSGDIYPYANHTGIASKHQLSGNVSEILEALGCNGFRLANAYPAQCYSIFKGEARTYRRKKESLKLEKSLKAINIEMQSKPYEKNIEYIQYDIQVDWDAKWKEKAVYVHGYYGVNAAWILDI